MKEKGYSQRRACALAGIDPRVYRRRSKRPADTELRSRMKELASERRGFGYRCLHILLKREGWEVNWKKLYRLYREEGLTVRKRGGRKRAVGTRTPMAIPQGPNQRWSLDFMSDALEDGRRFRVLNLIDDFSRECLAAVVDTSIGGVRVARELDRIAELRGYPCLVVSDNGTELTSNAMLKWQEDRKVDWHYIAPGKPMQNRPLEPCYPVVFMDAIRVNIRSDGAVSNKAVFVALAILPDGTRDVLGLWFQANEGAKFWAKVLNDLRNRGVQDILIAVVDGLKGFPEAIEAAFPKTQVQTCIVHLLRHSMSFASYKDRKAVAKALKAVYTAVDVEAAESALAEFEQSDLAAKYPAITPSWRRAWNEVIPFLDYPPEVRRLIYTTNAIEALNAKIRRAVRTRGHFPSDEAAAKLIYLALNATSQEWKRSVREWHAVKSQLAIMFEDRFPMA